MTLVEQLRVKANSLENENYHTEAALMRDVAELLDTIPPQAQEIVRYVLGVLNDTRSADSIDGPEWVAVRKRKLESSKNQLESLLYNLERLGS